MLIRTVYSPIRINQETGVADPAHFRNDALKRGFSVNRKHHVREADLRKTIESKITRDRHEGKESDDFSAIPAKPWIFDETLSIRRPNGRNDGEIAW